MEAPVVALEVVKVLLRLAVLPYHTATALDLLVVGRDGAALTTGTEVLSRIEAERRGGPDRAGLLPALFACREVLGAVRLAGVLDDHQPVFGGQIDDRIHVGH